MASLVAIPTWVDAVCTSKSWVINRHITQCTSDQPISMISQHKLVSGWGLQKWRSVLDCGPVWLKKCLYVCFVFLTNAVFVGSLTLINCPAACILSGDRGTVQFVECTAHVRCRCYTQSSRLFSAAPCTSGNTLQCWLCVCCLWLRHSCRCLPH